MHKSVIRRKHKSATKIAVTVFIRIQSSVAKDNTQNTLATIMIEENAINLTPYTKIGFWGDLDSAVSLSATKSVPSPLHGPKISDSEAVAAIKP